MRLKLRIDDDVPLVATKPPTTGKIVGLNFFPPSGDAGAGLWTATTDGARLMGDALAWREMPSSPDTRRCGWHFGAPGSAAYLTDVQSKLNNARGVIYSGGYSRCTGLHSADQGRTVNNIAPCLCSAMFFFMTALLLVIRWQIFFRCRRRIVAAEFSYSTGHPLSGRSSR